MSKQSSLIDLSGKITRAWQKRSPLREHFSAFRAINGAADDLPGLTIDIIGKIGIFSSTSESIDKNTDRLTEILVNKLGLETVWIKNDIPQRKRAGLILSNYIAQGPSPVPQIIIKENDLTYFWNSTQKIFAIAERPLRLWFHQEISVNLPETKTSVLILGFSEDDIVSVADKNTPLSFSVTVPPEMSLTQYCQDVRKLKETSSYTTLIVNHPWYTPSLKNKTALFHFYFHLFDLIDRDGLIFLSCPFWHKVKNTFDHVAKRKKRNYKILATAPPESDFKDANNKAEIAFLKIQMF